MLLVCSFSIFALENEVDNEKKVTMVFLIGLVEKRG